jgi:hypothetical protein
MVVSLAVRGFPHNKFIGGIVMKATFEKLNPKQIKEALRGYPDEWIAEQIRILQHLNFNKTK